jgi:recA bacterial DNA recombination protein
MSSQPWFAGAATGRHFIFAPESVSLETPPQIALEELPSFRSPRRGRLGLRDSGGISKYLSETSKLSGVTPASRLEVRAAPEMVSSGIAEVDSLTGGLPRGCLTEICGPASSGRTSVLLAAIAAATERQEVCALVDTSDALDPQSAAAAGIDLKKLLWIRCCGTDRQQSLPQSHPSAALTTGRDAGRDLSSYASEFWEQPLEQALKITDLLLQSSGFGLVAIDLGDVPLKFARRIPLTSWFRFRRVVENTSTVLLVIEQRPIAGSCSSLLLRLEARSRVLGGRSQGTGRRSQVSGLRFQDSKLAARTNAEEVVLPSQIEVPSHSQLLEGFRVSAEILRLPWKRKLPQSVETAFETKVAWAG